MSLQSVHESQFKLLTVEHVIRAGDSPSPETAQSHCTEPPVPETEVLDLDTVILNHVRHVLELNHGNKRRAARRLGISRSTLYRILGNDSTVAS